MQFSHLSGPIPLRDRMSIETVRYQPPAVFVTGRGRSRRRSGHGLSLLGLQGLHMVGQLSNREGNQTMFDGIAL